MAEIYRFEGWHEVARLFEGLNRSELTTVGAWLSARAGRLRDGWAAGNPAAAVLLSNWHPEFVGAGVKALESDPTHVGARVTVAREHGFEDWAAAERAGDRTFDADFEAAVDLALAGRLDELHDRLTARPDLVRLRSPFGHGATLLHYMAANGVETERQVTPLNAAEVVRLLLEAGAERDATMPVYGGDFTTLELLRTSAHPALAGVVDEMAAPLSE